MGFQIPIPPVQCRQHLQPGDRLLLYTDGIVEARDPAGHQFGLQRFTDFIIRREADGLSAPETLRRLMHAILDYQHERLQDDASVLMVEWRNSHEQRMLVSHQTRDRGIADDREHLDSTSGNISVAHHHGPQAV